MKTVKKLILIILSMIITIYSLIPPKAIKAINGSAATVGEAIASTAEDFCKRYKGVTIYNYVNWTRVEAYKNKPTNGTAYNTKMEVLATYEKKYAMDCVGFVSMIIHCATGLGESNDNFTYFVGPSGPTGYGIGRFSKYSKSEIQRGDIICWDSKDHPHVAIAIDSTTMIDAGMNGTDMYGNKDYSITTRPISNYHPELDYFVVRINNAGMQNINTLHDRWYPQVGSTDWRS